MPHAGRGRGRGCGGDGRDSSPGHGGPFRGHGRRMTGPRRLILGVLEASEDYLSAEEVYMSIYAGHPGIGIATVYRTLQLLAEMGIAQRVDTGDGKARYKLGPLEDQKRRVVLVCTNCSRTTAIPARTGDTETIVTELEQTIANHHGFRADRTIIQLFGLCDQCV
jgi:Fur family transcriptional regulator, ferric uptake regulator